MIKLSNRLQVIADYINKEDNVIDIGCDHALLDIYLSIKYNKNYIASDLRSSALEFASENIKKYNVKNKIEIRCSDGFDAIYDNDNIDTVVISGMGFYTILKILKNKSKLSKINKLIIQSNSNTKAIRKYMLNNGFYIENEKIAQDKNLFYIISCYKRGKRKYSKMDIEVGIFKNDEISRKYIDIEIKKYKLLLKFIPITDFIKRFEIRRKLNLMIKRKVQ